MFRCLVTLVNFVLSTETKGSKLFRDMKAWGCSDPSVVMSYALHQGLPRKPGGRTKMSMALWYRCSLRWTQRLWHISYQYTHLKLGKLMETSYYLWHRAPSVMYIQTRLRWKFSDFSVQSRCCNEKATIQGFLGLATKQAEPTRWRRKGTAVTAERPLRSQPTIVVEHYWPSRMVSILPYEDEMNTET